MTQKWKVSKKGLNGNPCTQLRDKGMAGWSTELCLAGKYGEIWQFNKSNYRAVITSARIARRYLPKEQHPKVRGDEILITFPESELSIWIERLQVPKERRVQARRANDFGKRGSAHLSLISSASEDATFSPAEQLESPPVPLTEDSIESIPA